MTILPFLPECHSYGKLTRYFLTEMASRGISIRPPDHSEPVDLLLLPPDSVEANKHRIYSRSVIYTMNETTRLRQSWLDTLNTASAVIVPSGWCASCFQAQGVNVPIYVVPLGFDPSVFFCSLSEPDTEEFRFSTSVTMSTGRTRKNVEALIQAFDMVRLRIPEAVLHIKTDFIPSDLSLSVPGVEWQAGYLAESDYADWVRATHCGIFISKGEGYGLCPLEYLACGVPIIAHRFSGLTEHLPYGVIRECSGELVQSSFDHREVGLWFEAEPRSVAAEMLAAYEEFDEFRARVIGVNTQLQRLTWTSVTNRLVSVLQKVGLL